LTIQNTRIVCWLAAVEAEVHAYLGDAASCDAALKRAKNSSKNEPLGGDQYATGFSASRLAGYEGACLVRLHQPDRALPALQEALALLDPQAIRRQSTLLTDMGIAYAQQGNIQQACQLAVQALSIT
jgi:tetratricopeptide (TPR) repeat protein